MSPVSEPVDTSAEAVRVVAVEEEARIESALRYDDSEYQLAFQEGYLRAMTIAERRSAKERAEQETLLAERNRQNARAFADVDRMRAKLLELAGECAECGGDGLVMSKSGPIEHVRCTDCKDIWDAAGVDPMKEGP